MQTLTQIKQMLSRAGVRPHKRRGQCYLIDHNLMGKLLDLAEVGEAQTVLEVGPGTGSLTEELLALGGRVVAVEIDRALHELLNRRLGRDEKLTLLRGDVLSGKHAISPRVLLELGPRAHLVANLPYSIATPLVAECLLASWHATKTGRAGGGVCFDRLTFTVQREVADRMAAGPGNRAYGPVSVLVRLLGRLRQGPALPPTAFWPRPKVQSRILRIDFDPAAAGGVASVAVLQDILRLFFGQRRKQIGSIVRKAGGWAGGAALGEALAGAGIEPTDRAERIGPEKFRLLANALAGRKPA